MAVTTQVLNRFTQFGVTSYDVLIIEDNRRVRVNRKFRGIPTAGDLIAERTALRAAYLAGAFDCS